jgi:hypothetical protein
MISFDALVVNRVPPGKKRQVRAQTSRKNLLNTLLKLNSTESQLPLYLGGNHELGYLRFHQNM